MSFYNWWGFAFFIFPAMKVYAIQQIPILDTLFDVWGLVSCIMLMITAIRHRIKNVIVIKCIYIFVLIYIIATALNYPDQLLGAISESARLLIVPLYMLILTRTRHEKSFLIKLRKSFLFLMGADILVGALQLAGVMLLENRDISFLGLDNYAAFIIVPIFTIIFYVSYICVGHIQLIDIVLYLLAFLIKIMTHSLTAILALALLGLIVFLGYHWKIVRAFVTPKKALLGMVFLLILIVVFGIQNYFKPLFDYLGKDVTLSYRTVIWSKVIASLPDALLLGYGKTNADQFRTIVGFSLIYDVEANHPHSYYLAILFSTGIMGVMVYVKMLFETFKKLYHSIGRKINCIFTSGLISFFVLAFADDYIMLPYFYMLICIIVFNDSIVLGKDQTGH